jgi:hypothetical protein
MGGAPSSTVSSTLYPPSGPRNPLVGLDTRKYTIRNTLCHNDLGFIHFPQTNCSAPARILYSTTHGSWKCKWLTEFGDPHFSPKHSRPLRTFCKKRPKEGGTNKHPLHALLGADGSSSSDATAGRAREYRPHSTSHPVSVLRRDTASPRSTLGRGFESRQTGERVAPSSPTAEVHPPPLAGRLSAVSLKPGRQRECGRGPRSRRDPLLQWTTNEPVADRASDTASTIDS